MGNSHRRAPAAIVVLILAATFAHASDKLEVRIVGRQENGVSRASSVAGFSHARPTSPADPDPARQVHANGITYVDCSTQPASSGCAGPTGTALLARPGFTVVTPNRARGATLALQLPNGRVAVVTCAGKTDWTNPSRPRDCRVPPVPVIQAEFDGRKAKLRWPASVDGKKTKSETYEVLAVLERLQGEAPD